MTKFQQVLVGCALTAVGIGLSVYGWCANNPDAVTFGFLCFGIGTGALGINSK